MIKIWVYSNLHIALIAFLLSVESNYFLGIPFDFKSPLFVFFGTLFIYNLGYYKAVIFFEKAQRTQVNWMRNHIYYWIFTLLISFIAVLYLFSTFSWQAKIIIIILSMLSFIYVIQEFTIAKRRFSIRNIPYLKTFIVSSVWASITMMPQIFDYNLFRGFESWILLFLERFLFILPITLMFDIRDIDSDPKDLHTIPKRIGIKTTKVFAILSLLIGLYLTIRMELAFETMGMITILYLLMICSVIFSSQKRSELYYSAYFDGLMGVHALIIISQFI